jgi:hypothetical protein
MEQALGYGYESFILSFDPDPSDSSYFVELFAVVRRRRLLCGMGFESWGLPDSAFIDAFAKTFVKKKSYIAISPENGSERVRKKNKGYYYSNDEMFCGPRIYRRAKDIFMYLLQWAARRDMRRHKTNRNWRT